MSLVQDGFGLAVPILDLYPFVAGDIGADLGGAMIHTRGKDPDHRDRRRDSVRSSSATATGKRPVFQKTLLLTSCTPRRGPRLPHAIFLAALVPLVVACDTGTGAPAVVVDSAGIRIVTSDPMGLDATCTLSDEPIFSVGGDESDEAQWFSSIRGVGRLSDGSVAVIDRTSAEIRVFDGTGQHLRSMGRPGEGPGEFNDAWKLWVLPGDTLWAGDYRPWRYNVFARDGNWVRAVQMDPIYGNPSRRGGVLDNGISINTVEKWPSPRDFSAPDTVVVEVHGPNGELLDTLAEIPHTTYGRVGGNESFTNMYRLFTASAVVEAGGSMIALAHTSAPEVRMLDDELELRGILRWSASQGDVTAADARAWRDEYIESRGGRDSPGWSPLDDAVVSD